MLSAEAVALFLRQMLRLLPSILNQPEVATVTGNHGMEKNITRLIFPCLCFKRLVYELGSGFPWEAVGAKIEKRNFWLL